MKREPQPRSFHLKLPVASGTGLGHGRTKQKIGKAKFNVHGRNTRISLGARQQKSSDGSRRLSNKSQENALSNVLEGGQTDLETYDERTSLLKSDPGKMKSVYLSGTRIF
jgi:hypothetical protein